MILGSFSLSDLNPSPWTLANLSVVPGQLLVVGAGTSTEGAGDTEMADLGAAGSHPLGVLRVVPFLPHWGLLRLKVPGSMGHRKGGRNWNPGLLTQPSVSCIRPAFSQLRPLPAGKLLHLSDPQFPHL